MQPQIKGTQLDQVTLATSVDTCLASCLGGNILISSPVLGETLVFIGSPIGWRNSVSVGGITAGDGLNSVGGSPIGSPITQVLSVDSTVARLNRALNTFSFAGAISFNLIDTTQKADEKIWRISNSGGQLLITTWTDTGGVGNNAIVIKRTGTTVNSIVFPSPIINTASGVGTKSAIQLNSAVPTIVFNDTDATATETIWDITSVSESKSLEFRTRTDAHGTGTTWMQVVRSGTKVTTINLEAISVTINGNEVLTSGDIKSIIQTVVEQVLAQLNKSI
ncbi:hypothetical protein LCGC14_1556870 [marine sediment metagenome]|uniref:Uncharacterized protein n=1 Tax=marine sediment metagenome TaxID=412755 RepID=A0A0F9L4Z9_9ZZZZ